MTTFAEVAAAAGTLVSNVALPVRLPSYTKSTFWSSPLTVTRLRPVPVGPNFVDFLIVPPLGGSAAVIYKYVAEGFEADAMEFQWLLDGQLVAPDSFVLTPGIDRHLDRFLTAPFPCRFRPIFLRIKEGSRSVIRARNLTQRSQYAFGAVFGWYYPVMQSPADTLHTEGIDDAVRDG
jgi:hypothetical protein